MSIERDYTLADRLCLALDDALRAMFDTPQATGRASPAKNMSEPLLTEKERQHAAGCMRVNHAGEVAAQGLYHGQGMVSRSPVLRAQMAHAAREEGDHLLWCSQRLAELGSHRSMLTPFWYGGSLLIGVCAGLAGDRWSLGFLAETEEQVMRHLSRHLASLPSADIKSRSVLEQMQQDEAAHRDEALEAGAVDLPQGVKKMMGWFSAVMVQTAYRF